MRLCCSSTPQNGSGSVDQAKLSAGREGIDVEVIIIWDWTRILQSVSLDSSATKTDWTHRVHKMLDVCPVRRLLLGLDLDSGC